MAHRLHPVISLVLAAVGAVAGATLASEGNHLFAIAMGALAGLGVLEVIYVRDRLTRLERELDDLRERQDERAPASADASHPTRRLREAALYEPPVSAPPPAAPPARPRPAQNHATASSSTASDAPPSRSVESPLPDPDGPIVGMLREYFTGGNALVRAGVVVLFFGVAFLLRYLAEHTHVPIEFRLSGVALGAVVLLVLGWRLRTKRSGYALALQGGAIGILYLTVFSALHIYALLSPGPAFTLLAIISALTAILAVLQGSLAVALLGVTGGFLAPFLASTGAGNQVALFSYFAVLNAVILGIAWFRSWRLLNLAGFGFTLVLATVWGVLQYRPQYFNSTEPFLALFFLIYVSVAVLYSNRQEPRLQHYIDGTIVFGTPIAAFGLQAAMLRGQSLALAYSALVVSALYVSLAWLLHRRRGERRRQLVEAFIALGVAFLTLSIPLALNGRWSAASWALEGAALTWVGCRQGRPLARAFGALLQIAAGGAVALTISSGASIPAGTYIAALMVGVASVCAAMSLQTRKANLSEYEQSFPGVLFFWGLTWWCIGGVSELGQHVDKSHTLSATLIFAAGTALLCSELVQRARMPVALVPELSFIPVTVFFAFWAAIELHHPLTQGGWVSWPLAFVSAYWILRRHEKDITAAMGNTLHAVTLWLLAALTSWELTWAIAQSVGTAGSWSITGWAILPAIILAVLPYAESRIRWPVQVHRQAYLVLSSAGLALYLALWSFETDVLVASPSAPLPYFPVVNPLDLMQAVVIIILTRFCLRLRFETFATEPDLDLRPAGFALSFLTFLWLNSVLLRTVHLWSGIPYELKAMLPSTLVESALSIFWAFLALATMLIATRSRMRIVWLTGAVLLGVVVIKLFVVDLSSVGTVERIVSFVGVGLLMLVLGYFSPLPPVAEQQI